MNEKSTDQIEEEVLICEISDEAVEAAGTRAEIAACIGHHTQPNFRELAPTLAPSYPGLGAKGRDPQ